MEPPQIVAFARELRRRRDPVVVCFIVVPILIFSTLILSLPFSERVRRSAAARFQLSGWPFAPWALLQPVPSMYNFENDWDVSFTPGAGVSSPNMCRLSGGFINHHVFNSVLLRRAELERCGLPAHVHYRTTYRGTVLESRYLLTPGPGPHGFVVLPEPR